MSEAIITESYWSHDEHRAAFANQNPEAFKQAQYFRSVETTTGFSYKPFDDHRCIFFHIPKGAGISVAKSLFGNLGGGHIPAKNAAIIFSKHEFESYFKFTFVRNPWDRLLSAYKYIKAGGLLSIDRKWAVENMVPYKTFESFVLKGLRQPNILEYIVFQPQCNFLCFPDSNELVVDFLGFYENLSDDFNYVANKLGLTVQLGHENRSSYSGSYKNAYTAEMRDVVANVYRQDIEILGYTFDNSSLPSQLINRPKN